MDFSRLSHPNAKHCDTLITFQVCLISLIHIKLQEQHLYHMPVCTVVNTYTDDGLKWICTGSRIQILSPPSSASDWYLGSDGCGCDVGGGAVLSGRHTAVLLLLVLLLALHAFVLRLPARRTVGRRGEGRRRRRQVLQLVRRLLYLHHGVPQEVDGVRQRWQDELEAFLDEERNKRWL